MMEKLKQEAIGKDVWKDFSLENLRGL